MKSKYELGVFIFRRDLRLDDNHGLINLAKQCKRIFPVFCLDQNQIVETESNKNYRSNHAVQFMCESLIDLNNQLVTNHNSRLNLFFGLPWEILANIFKELKQTISPSIICGWNHDYSEYSKDRDSKMVDACKSHKIPTLISDTDLLLRPMEEYKKKNGPGGFKQFSPFWQQASINKPMRPLQYKEQADNTLFVPGSVSVPDEFNIQKLSQFYTFNPQLAQRGGRDEGLMKLANIKKFKDYGDKRDMLLYSPTNLSAAINFGCVSVREAYWSIVDTLGISSELVRQLYWRDFLYQMAVYEDHSMSYTRMIDIKFDHIRYSQDHKIIKSEWDALIAGKTGFLMIDAAIEEMKKTGYMPNRARMLLGMMWSKYLMTHIYHPVYGLQVGFSKYLVDAIGPTQNKLSCAWCVELDFAGRRYAAAGVPLSGRPMDISNKQIKKWDPECKYIKKWLPHLSNIPIEALLNWDEPNAKKFKYLHPAPIFDASARFQTWVDSCRNI
jgi:deoxyribodipyrimidine photo-lyase